LNIFFLDESFDPDKTAINYVDKHVIKIITEINSCLSSAYPKGVAPYKHTHINHPICKWIRSSLTNFNWSIQMGLALCREYTFRYGKIHAGQKILNWYLDNLPKIPDVGWTMPPQCFGDFKNCFVEGNPVLGYKNYYLTAKRHLFSWKNRNRPEWTL